MSGLVTFGIYEIRRNVIIPKIHKIKRTIKLYFTIQFAKVAICDYLIFSSRLITSSINSFAYVVSSYIARVVFVEI